MRACKKDHKRKEDEEGDSDNEADEDKSDNSDGVEVDNSPKIIPVAKLSEKLKTKKIVINISDTQYPIVEQIAEQLGWMIQRKQGGGNWDLWWTDREIHSETLIKMNFHQKINHFPAIEVLARKNLLGLNLMAMREHFQEEYNFFPQTWTIPLEYPKFRNYYESCPKGKIRTYIVKPEAMSQGRGIFLTRNIQDITNGCKYVVQRYIKNPYLIDGLKFDLRIYVLMAGTDPLRLYIYEEGLTRLATRKYEEPSEENLGTSFIHLTNYSLNKSNPDFIYNTSVDNMDVGHKRTLSSTYLYLEKKGHDVEKLKKEINDLIIKTIISGLPAMAHQYQACQPEEYSGNMCFHILGIDVMITQDLKPYLIEINHTPSFQTETPLDYKVKKSLIMDSLKIMQITTKKKKELFEKAKLVQKRRIETGKRQILKGDERKLLVKQAQKQRDLNEQNKLGGFTKIYPLQEEAQNEMRRKQYCKMIERAEEVHKSTQEQRKKLIREEQDRAKLAKKSASQEPEKNFSKEIRNRKAFNSSSLIQKEVSMTQSANIPARRATPDIFVNKVEDIRKNLEHSQSKRPINTIHNIVQTGQKSNLVLRKKLYNNIIPMEAIQQKEEVIRFSEYMQKYLFASSQPKTKNLSNTSNNLPEINSYFSGTQERKKTDQNKEEKLKSGTFVIPKTYSIVDSNHSVLEKAAFEQKKEQFGTKKEQNSIPTQIKHLKAVEVHKNVYKKRKNNYS